MAKTVNIRKKKAFLTKTKMKNKAGKMLNVETTTWDTIINNVLKSTLKGTLCR